MNYSVGLCAYIVLWFSLALYDMLHSKSSSCSKHVRSDQAAVKEVGQTLHKISDWEATRKSENLNHGKTGKIICYSTGVDLELKKREEWLKTDNGGKRQTSLIIVIT